MQHDSSSDADAPREGGGRACAAATSVEHAYPSDLGARVLHRWHEARSAGGTGLAPPDPAALTALLSICYQATLLREEDRPVTFRLAVSDPGAFDPTAGPPSGLHRLVFTRRLPLDPHELRRLSPAAVFSRSLIGVTLAAPGGPAIWGVIHSGPQWLQAVRGGREHEQSTPHVLIVSATGPGRLLVSIGSLILAELRNGTLSGVEMDVFQSHWMRHRLRELGHQWTTHTGDRTRRHDGGAARDADVAASLAGQVLRRMLATVRAGQHGGTLIVIPHDRAPELLSDGRYMHMKYTFDDEEPRRRIGTIITGLLTEPASVEGRHGTDGGHAYDSRHVGHAGGMDEALFEVAHFIADLTHVDGTVLLTDSLEVLGFGVEIAGELPEVTRVARARDLEGTTREWVRTDRVGTRHRSAYRLCQALHEALTLVVSQDGGLRFIRWHVDGVTYWEQLATGPAEA